MLYFSYVFPGDAFMRLEFIIIVSGYAQEK